MTTAFDSILRGRIAVPVNDSILRTTIYVRPGGNDDAPGTEVAPLATFKEAIRRLPLATRNEYITIDITGIDEEIGDFAWATPQTADRERINFNPTAHRTWGIDYPCSLRAVPTLVEALNTGTTSSSAGSVHGNLSITDTSKNWAIDEHKYRFLVGAAIPFGPGFIPPTPLPIISNTTNTLVVAGSTVPTGPFEILEPSARLRFGDAPEGGIPFAPPFSFHAQGSFGCQWVRFGLNPAAIGSFGINISSSAPGLVNFSSNRFDDGVRVGEGNSIDLDEAVLTGGFVAFEASDGNRYLRRCIATGVNFTSHFGTIFVLDVRFQGCTPFPGTTTNYTGLIDLSGAEIMSSTGDGLRLTGGAGLWRVQNTVISNCVSAGIRLRGTGLVLRNVSGTGNAIGLHIRDNAWVERQGVVNLNAGGIEISAGGALGNRLWSSAPFAEYSAATSVRVY